METMANGHRLLDDSDDSDQDSISRPPTGAGGTYEDDFERGLECDVSTYDDDMPDRGPSENGNWVRNSPRSYVLDPTAYGDSDEDLERELTLGLGLRRGMSNKTRPNYELFDRDFASNGRDGDQGRGPARVFMDFFRRNRLDARTTSEPSLAHSKGRGRKVGSCQVRLMSVGLQPQNFLSRAYRSSWKLD